MDGGKVALHEDGTLYINGKPVGFFDIVEGEPIQLIFDSKYEDEIFAKVVFEEKDPIFIINYTSAEEVEFYKKAINDKHDYVYQEGDRIYQGSIE